MIWDAGSFKLERSRVDGGMGSNGELEGMQGFGDSMVKIPYESDRWVCG